MILYAESSAVLAWLLGEPSASSVIAELRRASAVYCSRLTLLECSRALVAATEMQRITVAEASQAAALLAQAARAWSVLELTSQICSRAGQRFPVEPVRSLDALHLASLVELQARELRIQPLALDQRVRANCGQLGFTALP